MACNTTSSAPCSPAFITAADARNNAKCLGPAYAEIQILQQAILEAISNCQYSVTISDGTPYTAINSVSGITITNPGTGYNIVPPILSVNHPFGQGAVLTPVLENGKITSIVVESSGTGYGDVEPQANTQSYGNGDAAIRVFATAAGTINYAAVLIPGTGYLVNQEIEIEHPVGSGAVLRITQVNGSGGITGLQLVSAGSGYTIVNATLSVQHPTGFGFSANPIIINGSVVGVQIINPGAGYSKLYPRLVVNTYSGSGLAATFQLSDIGGVVGAQITNPGSGYVNGETFTILPAIGGSGSGAAGTIQVAPPGMTQALEYYLVWMGQLEDRVKKQQLDFIINHFKCLGYNITLRTNPVTGRTLSWHISW